MRVRMTENNETTVKVVKYVVGFMSGSIFMISEEYEFEGKINEVGSKLDRLSSIIGRPVYLLVPVIRHFSCMRKYSKRTVVS
jgi:hypothetical protein